MAKNKKVEKENVEKEGPSEIIGFAIIGITLGAIDFIIHPENLARNTVELIKMAFSSAAGEGLEECFERGITGVVGWLEDKKKKPLRLALRKELEQKINTRLDAIIDKDEWFNSVKALCENTKVPFQNDKNLYKEKKDKTGYEATDSLKRIIKEQILSGVYRKTTDEICVLVFGEDVTSFPEGFKDIVEYVRVYIHELWYINMPTKDQVHQKVLGEMVNDLLEKQTEQFREYFLQIIMAIQNIQSGNASIITTSENKQHIAYNNETYERWGVLQCPDCKSFDVRHIGDKLYCNSCQKQFEELLGVTNEEVLAKYNDLCKKFDDTAKQLKTGLKEDRQKDFDSLKKQWELYAARSVKKDWLEGRLGEILQTSQTQMQTVSQKMDQVSQEVNQAQEKQTTTILVAIEKATKTLEELKTGGIANFEKTLAHNNAGLLAEMQGIKDLLCGIETKIDKTKDVVVDTFKKGMGEVEDKVVEGNQQMMKKQDQILKAVGQGHQGKGQDNENGKIIIATYNCPLCEKTNRFMQQKNGHIKCTHCGFLVEERFVQVGAPEDAEKDTKAFNDYMARSISKYTIYRGLAANIGIKKEPQLQREGVAFARIEVTRNLTGTVYSLDIAGTNSQTAVLRSSKDSRTISKAWLKQIKSHFKQVILGEGIEEEK